MLFDQLASIPSTAKPVVKITIAVIPTSAMTNVSQFSGVKQCNLSVDGFHIFVQCAVGLMIGSRVYGPLLLMLPEMGRAHPRLVSFLCFL